MRLTFSALLMGALLALSLPTHAEPITQLITSVAQKANKKVLIDPRVNAEVTLVGQRAADLSYADLLTILQLYGFAAVEGGGYVRVVPDSGARMLVTTIASGNRQNYADAELVNRIIPVKTMPAAQLVPILRPLIPQFGHLAAVTCRNTLLIVDTYANVKRIESLVQALDTGSTAFTPEKCESQGSPNAPTRN
jgi:general secretion pathway protein D